MCGRYTVYMAIEDVLDRWQCYAEGAVAMNWQPRYNLAPAQQGLVIVQADKGNVLRTMRWGLIPRWAKDMNIGNRLINARLETLDEKSAFRSSLQRRRCIIPANGFYEWQKRASGKAPFYITRDTGDPFCFAGLWDTWTAPTGESLNSFTIITTVPAESLKSIHNRMPLVLPRELENIWLAGPGQDDMKLFLSLLRPEDRFVVYRVSDRVNKPANDSPELIVPA